jgi:adenosylcobinamide-GDP ribazoletransferase
MPALVISTVLGRWTSPLVIFAFPYTSEKGIGRAMKENVRLTQVILASGIALLATWQLDGVHGVGLMATVAAVAFGLGFYFMRLLDGLTGDNYGTVTEITEALILLVFAFGN